MSNVIISVILPTYNRVSTIKHALESIFNQTFNKFEIIVIDDSPTDIVYNYLFKYGYLDKYNFRYYRNPKRLGLPASRNRGVLLSKGELILFVEDDVVLAPDVLAILYMSYKVLKKKLGNKIGAIIPARPIIKINYDSPLLNNFITNHLPLPIIESPISHINYQKYNTKFNYAFEILGGHPCSLFEKAKLIEIKLFDSERFKGSFEFEETDLFTRLRKKGYFLVYQPKAVLYHFQVSEGGCKTSLFKKSKSFIINYTRYLIKNSSFVMLMPRLFLALTEIFVMFVLTKMDTLTKNL